MAFFKVRKGNYVSSDGVTHKQGEVFESYLPLDRKFKNSFEVVGSMPVQAPILPVQPYVAAPSQNVPPTAGSTPTGGSSAPDVPPAAPVDPANRGKEVTESFKLAVDEDFQVFKTKLGYDVYDRDVPTKPINPAPVKRGDVTDVIKQALGR